MRGNSHVQFLMGKAAETPLTYITKLIHEIQKIKDSKNHLESLAQNIIER